MINTNIGCYSWTEAHVIVFIAIIVCLGEYRGAGFCHFLFGHTWLTTSFWTIFIVWFGPCLYLEPRENLVFDAHMLTVQVGKTKV